ncbi:hypothetical protein D3C73_582790 [compost metagenome]
MKKWMTVLLSITLIVSITACGQKADNVEAGGSQPASATNQPTPASKVETTKGVPTAEELIKKTSEASQKLKSYSMDSKMDQNISVTVDGKKQEQKLNMSMKTDMIQEPIAMYQEIKMTIPGMDQAQDIKQYITQEGIYMQSQGTWTKLPDTTKDQLMGTIKNQASPEKQLEQFKSITKDTKVTDDGGNYVMSATVSGENVKELAKKMVNSSGSANPQMDAMMEQMNIKSMKMTYAIKKDEYTPVSMNVEMTMDMDQQGQKISMDMKMDSTFSNYNKVAEIKVPAEALKSAS